MRREKERRAWRRGRCTTRQDAPVSQIHKADPIGCIIPVGWLQNGKQDCKYLPVVVRSQPDISRLLMTAKHNS
jgi:hypothetical protein